MALVLQGADSTGIIGNRKLIFHAAWAKDSSTGEESRTDFVPVILLSHVKLSPSYKLSGYHLSNFKTDIFIFVKVITKEKY